MTAQAPHDSDESLRVDAHEESEILRRLEVEVAPARVAEAFDRAYRDLARQVRVKGFRPGKAPRSVLEGLYGASLAEELEQRLVQETLPEAIGRSGLEPVVAPSIEAGAVQPGAAFRYSARIEIKPQIELPALEGLPARKPQVEVGDEQVAQELEALRQRHARLVEEAAETELQAGHIATIDFVGRIEGKPFEGGSAQGHALELGSGRFVPGFEEQLIGKRAGDDVEVRIEFPADYGNTELAGRAADFAVHIVSVQRREVPALDDEFAKDLGEFEDLAALKSRIGQDLQSMQERNAERELRRSVMDALIERTEFPVPPGLVERELERQLRTAHERLAQSLDPSVLQEQLTRWYEEWRPGAERQVREALLLEAVQRAQGIEAADADIAARRSEMEQQGGAAAVRWLAKLGEERVREVLGAQLAEEKTLEFLTSRARVEIVTERE